MIAIRLIYTQESINCSNNLRVILLTGEFFGLESIVLVCLEVLYPGNEAIFSVSIDDMLKENRITHNNYILGIRSEEFFSSLVKSMKSKKMPSRGRS